MAAMEDLRAETAVSDTLEPRAALRRAGAVLPLVLSVLTSISPLFGEEGIASVIPLPATLSSTGKPLITVLSLALTLLVSIIFLAGERRLWKTMLGVAVLIIALGTLGIYMTWITPNGDDVLVPFIPGVYGNVFATFVIGFAIAFLATSLVILASQLVAIPLAAEAPIIQSNMEELHRRKPSQSTAAEDLLSLVLTANWTRIEQGSANHRGPYWRLYGAISRTLVNQRQEAKDIWSARLWASLITLVDIFPMGASAQRKLLLGHAQAILPWLSMKNRAWRRIDRIGASPKDSNTAFNAYYERFFLSVKGAPDFIGYTRSIKDNSEALSELLKFRESLPGLGRLSTLQTMEGAAAIIRLQALSKSGLAKAEANFDLSVISGLAAGHSAEVAKGGYASAREFLDLLKGFLRDSVAWFTASHGASQAYCLAIAADQSEYSIPKLEALIYALGRSCELLHVDAIDIADQVRKIHRGLNEKGAELPNQLSAQVEAVLQKVDELPRSLFDSSA